MWPARLEYVIRGLPAEAAALGFRVVTRDDFTEPFFPLVEAVESLRRMRAPFPELGQERHEMSDEHPHVHGPECGHVAVPHGDHVDYVHDGHRHAAHGKHYDEH